MFDVFDAEGAYLGIWTLAAVTAWRLSGEEGLRFLRIK